MGKKISDLLLITNEYITSKSFQEVHDNVSEAHVTTDERAR